ncbi:hypothetical protein HYDPIDRAFT_176574 [Hydnomerulius pinastri MD-312]|uniref:BTB domain-containing protein n=1 Tax=Hydnomerulius pinastri MD-312 TaxID=994086 RepID=A0A0C9V9Z4_9AGAM|nr:hypothetical protein HYDPIDRAFT_176574 [Hydnomerulius pinastri MD-312]
MTVGSDPVPTTTTSYLHALVRSDIWFADGNVVLIAGSAAFKVHRGQLQRHSEVFRDLFEIGRPPPTKRGGMVEGCPTVDLYDCPSDVHHLLVALYDGLYFSKPHATDFSSLSSVLRLSTKYFIEHLRLQCLTRLSQDWPSTLADWDKREAAATDSSGRYAPRDALAHPILAINLALELGLPEVLPSAFFDLSRYGPSKILQGARAFPPPPVIHLSHDSLVRTLKGRESAQLYISTFLRRALAQHPSPSCLHSAKLSSSSSSATQTPTPSPHCTESFYFIQLNVLRSVGGIACGRDADPLYTLTQAAEMLERKDFSDGVRTCGLRMCGVCKKEWKGEVGRARAEVWGMIPGWFGSVDLVIASMVPL